MIALISRPVALLAGFGWALSIIASLAVLAGLPMPQWLPIPQWLWVGLPLGAALTGLAGQILLLAQREEILHWRTLYEKAMDRSPSWTRIAQWVSFVYSLCLIASGFGFDNPTYTFAGQLAFLGVFYVFALRLLMAASVRFKCSNGHAVGPFAKYCHNCGVAVPEAM